MAKKGKKRSRGRTITTMVELAGAAAGLVSLAYELMQRHQAGRQQTDPGSPQGSAPEREPPQRTGDHDHTGSLLGKAGMALGAASGLIDVNRAAPDVLRALQPIGKKHARRIVARRPFKEVKQLKRVLPKGVYRTIKHQLTVG